MAIRFSAGWRAGLGLAAAMVVGPLHAAFDVVGTLPPGLGAGPLSVSRESLETRESAPVATVRVEGGQFRLRADAEAGLFTLSVGEAEVSFVAAEGQTLRVAAAADGKTLRVEGGPDQERFAAYEAFRTASLARLVLPVRAEIAQRTAAGDEAEVERLTGREIAAYREHRRELNAFTLTQLRGSAALYAASLRWDGDDRLDELAAVVDEYAKTHPGREIARLMQERIARFRAVALGAVAPELAGPSPDGKAVALRDLRGRYVLVDFWASWCAPCRMENRHYTELYRRHHAEGFEILAVSVDQDARSWKAAIAKDGAAWRHISDLRGWKTPLAARYNVSALPASFLLDREGRIVAKDVRGKELAALLAEKLKAPAGDRTK
ncbi:MAG: TlpA disulfide reductase family protein [Verrucomicrobia bacterium]|nr:TlpA disulfide reductase family protein [Verrucomicrobiota bacterium]